MYFSRCRGDDRQSSESYFIGVFLKVHVGVLVGVDQFKLKLVDVEHGADVQVAQREVLGELDRVARLVRLLHTLPLQELPASEPYTYATIATSLSLYTVLELT